MKSATFDVTIRRVDGGLFMGFLIEQDWDKVDAYEQDLKAQYPSNNFSVKVVEHEEFYEDSFYPDQQN